MSTIVEANTPLAQLLQEAMQPKLLEIGWAADESDHSLVEYITNLLSHGSNKQEIITELGTGLLSDDSDDPAIAQFAEWLFNIIPMLTAQLAGETSTGGQNGPATQQQQQSAQTEQQAQQSTQQQQQQTPDQDMQVDEQTASAVLVPSIVSDQPLLTRDRPSGPKAMRDGTSGGNGRGRGRMLGQLNRQMDRGGDDKMLRIKGAAGGTGRINSHAGRDSNRRGRGNNIAGGMQRMMGGRPGQQHGGMPVMNQQQQTQLMQMMEMQSQMMAQILNGQAPDMGAFNAAPTQQQRGKSLFDRVSNKPKFSKNGQPDVEMGDDDSNKEPFDTVCRFNDRCTVATCPYAHQSPAAPPGTAFDTSDRCNFGAACENRKCAGKHPSPAQRRQHLSQDVECKFYPNCTNPACPFKHPDMPACRNGADCSVENCKFSHSKIMCRYNPCLNAACVYKHVEGQKRGKFEDKVWTADRLKSLKDHQEGTEELILPAKDTDMQTSDQSAEIIT
ncbi:hypothetical protein AMS68_004265 [Peltaster fructicola]|uniref:Nab2-like CCCH zinc finger domain-containing protein n=1 Tax=Peltaster fructicola TaxID=286661 RepID=A0A6H0XVX1_9PEZI|nr:hypothetical protein AMS68_004265 [Peltaster fructicola]